MKEKVLDVRTIHQCNGCFDCTTLHPLVSVLRLEDACVDSLVVRLGFYTVVLVEHEEGKSCCGCSHCDYADATMFFLLPGQEFKVEGRDDGQGRKGWLLAFHPDLLGNTTLDRPADRYTYFLYNKEEALHLSLREKEQITDCLRATDKELHHPVDRHSCTLMVRHIELLLDYCSRFYERQFIIREEKNKVLCADFERYWIDYVREGGLLDGRFPTVEACASFLHLSPQYFTDLLRFQFGMLPADYFRLRRMELARQMLQEGKMATGEIARWLGFPSVQQFSLCFKRLTGLSPSVYRLSRN